MISKAKYRWLILLVLILLISNIVLAIFLFLNDKKPDFKKMAEERSMILYNEIGLDKNQIDSFKQLKDDFIKDMKPVWGDVRHLKDSLYHSLALEPGDSTILYLLDSISTKTRETERKTFEHFHNLRGLCNDDQQSRFDTLMPKYLSRNRSRR
jgi:hypothetical protein